MACHTFKKVFKNFRQIWGVLNDFIKMQEIIIFHVLIKFKIILLKVFTGTLKFTIENSKIPKLI